MKLSLPRFSLWGHTTEKTTLAYKSRSPLNTSPAILAFPNNNGATCIFRRWKSKKKPEEKINLPDGTFTAAEMELNMMPDEKLKTKPEDWTINLWKTFTDYMFSVRWDDKNGWGTPSINPIGSFKIHPGSKCLQYGVEVHEGMKAYRGNDGFIRLFRPELNMQRFLAGAKRLHLPTFCPNQLIDCIKRLVKMEQEWIPEGEGHSLYIRPCFVGTEANLDYSPSKSALLYVVLCPVPDVKTTPISVYANPNYVKSWPGGFGDVKFGGNYGPMIHLQSLAEKHECQQIMWLQGEDEIITDLGYMNIFFVIKNENGEKELVTPPCSALLLNGVVRQSILEMCHEWKKFGISQRNIAFSEFKTLLNEKRVKEVFGTGTSNIICPVKTVVYDGSNFEVPTMKQEKPIYRKIKKALKDIYYGRIDHNWSVRIDDK